MSWRALFLAGAGATMLKIFYVALRTKWPLLYFQLGSAVDPIVRRSMWRFVAFRGGPVFLVVLFVAVTTSERWNESALGPCLLLILWHIGSTYGLGILRAARARQLGLRLATFWMASAAIVVAAAIPAYLLRSRLVDVVPPPSEMLAALWTGGFAAAVAVATIRTMSVDPLDTGALLARSETEIPKDLFEYARERCQQHNADYAAVRAVMLAENLQRPAWIRSLERFKGRFAKAGTYGIMQVQSPKPVSDRQSVDLAVTTHFVNTATTAAEQWWERTQRLEPVFKAYNSNPDFVSLAMAAIDYGQMM